MKVKAAGRHPCLFYQKKKKKPTHNNLHSSGILYLLNFQPLLTSQFCCQHFTQSLGVCCFQAVKEICELELEICDICCK